MIDLSDPRARIRVAGAADVCVSTVERFAKSAGKGVRASSARRIRAALDELGTVLSKEPKSP